MDRLVIAVGGAILNKDHIKCIAQVGGSKLRLKNIETFSTLPEKQFVKYAENADVIISHAGMGNILLAEELQKPIIVLARSTMFNESVNNHQFDTLRGLSKRHFIFQMESENDVERGLDWFNTWEPKKFDIPERELLTDSLRNYILSS